MKKISVITPMFNSFDLIKKNIGILEKMNSIEFELIIIDDCSTDNSYEKAINYERISNLDIKILRNEKNEGPGASRNRGIELATGDYITFIDSDDYISEEFESEIMSAMNLNIDCIIFDYILVNSKGMKIGLGKSMDINLQRGFIDKNTAFVYTFGTTWGKLYKKDIISTNNIKFASLFRNEDMPFTKKAILFSNSIYYLKRELYMYSQSETSLMHTSKLNDERNCQKAFLFLRDSLNSYEFNISEELEAIKLREVLNNSVKIMINNKHSKKQIKDYIDNNYDLSYKNNKYYLKYPIHVKIITFLIYHKCFFILKIIFKYKNIRK